MKFYLVLLFFVMVVLCQNVCFAMHRNKSDMEHGNPSNGDYVAIIGVTQQSHKYIFTLASKDLLTDSHNGV